MIDHNLDVRSVLSWAPKAGRKCKLVNIGFPGVRTEGRSGGRSVYGHVITKFSGMGRFT